MDEDFASQMVQKEVQQTNEVEKIVAQEKTLSLINKHFNNLLEPLGDDLDSDE